jgi:hypothetical protein
VAWIQLTHLFGANQNRFFGANQNRSTSILTKFAGSLMPLVLRGNSRPYRERCSLLQCTSPVVAVRPEGANHQWRKNPPGELSIDPVAGEGKRVVVKSLLSFR